MLWIAIGLLIVLRVLGHAGSLRRAPEASILFAEDPAPSDWTCPDCPPYAEAGRRALRVLPSPAHRRALVLCDEPPAFAALAWDEPQRVLGDVRPSDGMWTRDAFEAWARGFADASGGRLLASGSLPHAAHTAAVLDDGELVFVLGDTLGDDVVALVEQRAADGTLLFERSLDPPRTTEAGVRSSESLVVVPERFPGAGSREMVPLWIDADGSVVFVWSRRWDVDGANVDVSMGWVEGLPADGSHDALSRDELLASAGRVALQDDDPRARVRALLVLERADDPRAVAFLREGEHSASALVRAWCEARLRVLAAPDGSAAQRRDPGAGEAR